RTPCQGKTENMGFWSNNSKMRARPLLPAANSTAPTATSQWGRGTPGESHPAQRIAKKNRHKYLKNRKN
ncbi:MAG: hypothetical protein AAF349_27750, partial [Cyanobacteria bacterium P01_A01_bin.68]